MIPWPAPAKQPPPKGEKEKDKSRWPDWLKDTPLLSEQEAAGLRDGMIESLHVIWKQTDDLITRTNKQKADAYIWQTIDDDDSSFLADCILGAGMRMPLAAYAVRKIAESWNYYRAGAILLPRFVSTWQFYAEHAGFGGFR